MVSRSGSIDWLCLPRFDSGACFAALLDADKGGSWSIRPSGEIVGVERAYRPDSMVLETVFATADGKVKLVDCLAVEEGAGDPDARVPDVVLRIVHGIEGNVEMATTFRPRFDYGNVVPFVRARGEAIEAVGGPDALDFYAQVEVEIAADRHEATGTFQVVEGQEIAFVAAHRLSHHEPRRLQGHIDHGDLLARTDRFWRRWADRCTYKGERAELVRRSLLTLKALTFSPTGGIVAAPTTSLPEQIGGPRNWDYRYCWLRDSTFMLEALLEHGFKEEAMAWRDWLLRAVAGRPHDLQIMYGLAGERRLVEIELEWLEGYEGSAPVRIGNGAVDQFQLDVYGEVMDSFHSSRRAEIDGSEQGWELQRAIVDFVCANWREPDDGIWEVRSGPEHFVHSKVMAWVAIDRGISAVERFGKEGPVERWKETRDEIRRDVMANGIDEDRGCFTRAYGDPAMDAALLMLPLVGFIDADDPVMLSTIEHVRHELTDAGMLLRYKTHEVSDGLPPGEGHFLLCSFWLVDCLALIGKYDEATELFDRLTATANDVGLMSEQYDPRVKRQLGNFPQAFSHVALATSAMTLETHCSVRALNRGR